MTDMVKIGYSTDVEKRRKDLSNTSLPADFEICAVYETEGQLEDKKVHELIDNLNPHLRIASNREFYAMSPDEACGLLESIAIISGTRDKFKRYKDTKAEDTSKGKREPANFYKCKIPIGTIYDIALVEQWKD